MKRPSFDWSKREDFSPTGSHSFAGEPEIQFFPGRELLLAIPRWETLGLMQIYAVHDTNIVYEERKLAADFETLVRFAFDSISGFACCSLHCYHERKC